MFSGTLIKKGDKLAYSDSKEKLLYQLFLDKIKDGEEIEIFICKKGPKASVAQISKVHASIRSIAHDIGYSFDDMKIIVKERAGLCFEVEDDFKKKVVCKSFADCSTEEMALAIQACNEIAEKHGIILG
jgi:hypothetical protein